MKETTKQKKNDEEKFHHARLTAVNACGYKIIKHTIFVLKIVFN